jgi:hypothetical protein
LTATINTKKINLASGPFTFSEEQDEREQACEKFGGSYSRFCKSGKGTALVEDNISCVTHGRSREEKVGGQTVKKEDNGLAKSKPKKGEEKECEKRRKGDTEVGGERRQKRAAMWPQTHLLMSYREAAMAALRRVLDDAVCQLWQVIVNVAVVHNFRLTTTWTPSRQRPD